MASAIINVSADFYVHYHARGSVPELWAQSSLCKHVIPSDAVGGEANYNSGKLPLLITTTLQAPGLLQFGSRAASGVVVQYRFWHAAPSTSSCSERGVGLFKHPAHVDGAPRHQVPNLGISKFRTRERTLSVT